MTIQVWATDEWGNRASANRWGSFEEAQESLETLTNCINCTNCEDCNNCKDCIDCDSCIDCANIAGCADLTDCVEFVHLAPLQVTEGGQTYQL